MSLFNVPAGDQELVQAEFQSTKPEGDNVSVHKGGNFRCAHSNFLNLQKGKWLDDETLMACIRILLKQDTNCWSFGTFFLPKGLDEETNTISYSKVVEYGKKSPQQNLFKLEHLFFPIHDGGDHWTMVYVDMKKMYIYYYDSLKRTEGQGSKYQQAILNYLGKEYVRKYRKMMPIEKWGIVDTSFTEGPLQFDGDNCGAFVVLLVDAICTLKIPPEILFYHGDWKVTEEDMEKYRLRMGTLILRKDLPDIPDLPKAMKSKTISSPYKKHT
jgi:Ulp1 family protease